VQHSDLATTINQLPAEVLAQIVGDYLQRQQMVPTDAYSQSAQLLRQLQGGSSSGQIVPTLNCDAITVEELRVRQQQQLSKNHNQNVFNVSSGGSVTIHNHYH
jgi:hypothetical protein